MAANQSAGERVEGVVCRAVQPGRRDRLSKPNGAQRGTPLLHREPVALTALADRLVTLVHGASHPSLLQSER